MKRGFTLIEVLVSVSIFTMVALAAIASVIAANDLAKKTQNIRNAFDNLNFAIESMARSIRLGRDYGCKSLIDTSPSECPNGSNFINFKPGTDETSSDVITYKLVDKEIVKKLPNGTEVILTSKNLIEINDLRFIICRTQACDGSSSVTQPRVVILIKGETLGKVNVRSNFSIQTSVTQRKLQ